MAWAGTRRRGLRWLVPNPTGIARDAVVEALARLPPGARIADLGAGGRRLTPDTFTVDGNPATDPDLVCDLHDVPLPPESFDAVFCTGTLEHVTEPERVAREVVRLLRPGGVAHFDVPFIQGFHADPADYQRWTLPGLQRFCGSLGLVELESGVHLGPGSAVCWIVSEYVRAWLGDGRPALVAVVLVRAALQPLLWADRWLVKRPGAHRIASGVFVTCRKAEAAVRPDPAAAPPAASAA